MGGRLLVHSCLGDVRRGPDRRSGAGLDWSVRQLTVALRGDRGRNGRNFPAMDSAGAERVARNEAAFRRVNEAIERGRQTREGLLGFVCECGRLGCNEIIELLLWEYEAVRADARQFAVRPGHQTGPEEVIDTHERYLVVAKRGSAGDIAEFSDPR
jgi:hypothetical protein